MIFGLKRARGRRTVGRMSLRPRLTVGLLATLLLALPFGCGESDSEGDDAGSGGARDDEGLTMCCTLGALCHRVGESSGALEECHRLGHENDPAECRASYDRCMALCQPAEGGAGGGGGAPATPHACL